MFWRGKAKRIRVVTEHYKGLERRKKGSERRSGLDRRSGLERRKDQWRKITGEEPVERLLRKKDLGRTISQKFWREIQVLKDHPDREYSLPWNSKIKGYVVYRNDKFYIFTDRRFPEERRKTKDRRSNEGKQTEVIK